jgi:PAS domain S-box-containing protein
VSSAATEIRIGDERGYRLLVDAITDYAIYLLDADGRVASWNAGAQRFKQYTAEEILGQHFSRFYTPEDQATGLPARALAMARNEGRFEQEGWRVRKDGSRFWAHVVIDPVWGSNGALLGYGKVTRDLTERRKSEDALRSTEEQFRRLVQGVTDYAIYMLDPNGIVTNWNAGAQRIKGYTPEEIIGKSFALFYTNEDRIAGEPQKALDIARREGRFERENWRVRKDGTRFWASVVIDAIRDDQGTLIGFAKITRDATEKRKATQELELAREQLFQAQKMEAIGQLTGGVAHDFNNLLMAVIGSLELMRKRISGDDKAQRLIENALQGAERGVSLTRRMLAFARRQDLKPTSVDLKTTVDEMIALLTPSVGPQIAIQNWVSAGLPAARTDPRQLESVLLNLVVNARDAMPEGGVITIGAAEHHIREAGTGLAHGRYVSLSVTDTGEGMDSETLARAVEPFFTTKGVGKGTGLGLSMVHGLAEQSGGKFVLKSSPGAGTTAEFWLPVAETDAVASARPEVSSDERTASLHIVAVDDDPLVLMNTAAMLEDLGHVVTEARSGDEALSIIRSGVPVDLVVTDHAMPQMTGSELVQLLRSERPGLPVVLATGYAELPRGSVLDVPKLSKPFRQQELAEALRKAVDPVLTR